MATTYRYLFADLVTNDILAELSITGVSFNQQLNQAGTFQAHLLLSGVNTYGYNVDTYLWEAPTPKPTDDKLYNWDEDTLSWVEVPTE